MLIWIVASALASPTPAWYDPNRVASQSSAFAGFSEQSVPRFDALQAELSQASSALAQLEMGVLAVGERASPELVSHMDTLRRQAAHGYLVAQAYVDTLQEDSANTFGSALERALLALAETHSLQECVRPTGMAAMGPGRSGPNCEGEDMSVKVAEALDADAQLAADIEEILSIEWPDLKLPPSEQSVIPLSGDQNYLRMSALLQNLAPGRFTALGSSLEESLAPLRPQLEGPEPEKALAEAEALRAEYEQAVAAVGSEILDAIAPVLEKQGGSVGICANPASLGGCPGEDLTDSRLSKLAGDRKVRKRLKLPK
ncbi:MAG: hypothetical protein VX519_11840 [Myxococcota bacterium]|nr:hypothetical protein [Myxococcota bacterium]